MLIEQRSEEWFQLRRGKITSSEIHKIMGEKGLTETAKTYLLEKVCEHFGGVTEPAHGQALDWGTELEPVAIEHYEKVTGKLDKEEVKLINERLELAIEYMEGLKKEIKDAKPKLLLG